MVKRAARETDKKHTVFTSAQFLEALATFHSKTVLKRRVSVLAEAIGPLIPPGSRIIDLGCGDGALSASIVTRTQGVTIEGYEALVRGECCIPVHAFDGTHVPLDDASVDGVLLADVLHHTEDPMVLMREAVRVARHFIIIKDHRTSRMGAVPLLRFMDWVGNRAHHVALPYNYWSEAQWHQAWHALETNVEYHKTKLGLYPRPANWLFEHGLHFLAKLSKQEH